MAAESPYGRDDSRCDNLTETECYSYDPRPGCCSGHLRFRCPRHGGDRQKSLSVDPTNGHFRCFRCGIWGTLVEHQPIPHPRRKIVQEGWHQTQTSRPGWGETHRSPQAQPRPQGALPHPNPMTPHEYAVKRGVASWKAFPGSPAEAYARSRGVPDDLAASLRLGYWQGPWGNEASEWLTFPLRCPVTGRPVGVYGRNLHTDDQARKGRVLGSKGLFGAAATGPMPDDVVVVEGPFEVIAVMADTALLTARALCGSSLRPEWFDACLRVILLLDDDAPGQEATDGSVKLLADRRCVRGTGPQVLRLRLNSLHAKYGFKDLGEMLVRGVAVRLNLPELSVKGPVVTAPSAAFKDLSREKRAEDFPHNGQTFYQYVCEVFGPVKKIDDDTTLELFEEPIIPAWGNPVIKPPIIGSPSVVE
jgi:hypothetical protein